MNDIIYYYSATGNSLDFARKLVEGLGSFSLIPLAKFKNQAFSVEASRVGFVFPVYAWGPPRTVVEILSRMSLKNAKYIFAVACCGGTACNTIPIINKLLQRQGKKLDAGFVVRTPSYIDIDPDSPQAKLINYVGRHAGAPARPAADRLPEIIDAVRANRSLPLEHGDIYGSAIASFFYRKASKQMSAFDRNYIASGSCDGCGICTRICPRENIVLKPLLKLQRPVWNHDCEGCGACVTWCPKAAISQSTGIEPSGKHHEQVQLRDMLLRN